MDAGRGRSTSALPFLYIKNRRSEARLVGGSHDLSFLLLAIRSKVHPEGIRVLDIRKKKAYNVGR